MTSLHETGMITGTRDKDYDLIWYIEACLENALRLERYRQDAERDNDPQLVELFAKAQADSRKGAEMGKNLLASRLAGGTAAPAPGANEPGANEPTTDVMAPSQAPPE